LAKTGPILVLEKKVPSSYEIRELEKLKEKEETKQNKVDPPTNNIGAFMNIYHIQNKAKLICYDLHPQT
jgi:hypothetical protein